MAAQSVSIDKYPKGEHQVGEREVFGLGPWGLHILLQLAELHYFASWLQTMDHKHVCDNDTEMVQATTFSILYCLPMDPPVIFSGDKSAWIAKQREALYACNTRTQAMLMLLHQF